MGVRIAEISSKVDEARLDQARERLDQAALAKSNQGNPEIAKQAMDDIQHVKKLLSQTRKKHLKTIRQIEFDRIVEFFNVAVREYARPAEVSTFESLVRTAQRAIDSNSGAFESHLDEIRGKGSLILWRQDWFVIDRFKRLSEEPFLFLTRASMPNCARRAAKHLKLAMLMDLERW